LINNWPSSRLSVLYVSTWAFKIDKIVKRKQRKFLAIRSPSGAAGGTSNRWSLQCCRRPSLVSSRWTYFFIFCGQVGVSGRDSLWRMLCGRAYRQANSRVLFLLFVAPFLCAPEAALVHSTARVKCVLDRWPADGGESAGREASHAWGRACLAAPVP